MREDLDRATQLTGSVLASYHELDRWLNPELLTVPVRDTPLLDPFTLRERAEALEPRASTTSTSRGNPVSPISCGCRRARVGWDERNESQRMPRLIPNAGRTFLGQVSVEF